jgi:hypothetical protein
MWLPKFAFYGYHSRAAEVRFYRSGALPLSPVIEAEREPQPAVRTGNRWRKMARATPQGGASYGCSLMDSRRSSSEVGRALLFGGEEPRKESEQRMGTHQRTACVGHHHDNHWTGRWWAGPSGWSGEAAGRAANSRSRRSLMPASANSAATRTPFMMARSLDEP